MIKNKNGQIAVYIVVAMVLIAGIVIFFVLRENISSEEIPQALTPVYDFYLSCVEFETKEAIELASTQGGFIDVPGYVPGSEYAPFSSQLNFLGFPVPYWYYLTANGLIKEQVPSIQDIEREIANYVQSGLKNCDFERFRREGFNIRASTPIVNVDVNERSVDVVVDAEVLVGRDRDSARKTVHKMSVSSKLGKFYEIAGEIYAKQKEEAFLEAYAVDVLYSYAPVDGVEVQCGPKIWSTLETINSIRKGLEENVATLKFEGNYYELKSDDRKYFVVDKPVDEGVRVMYMRTWPTKIEISGEGVDDEVMIAEAVGTQGGLGAMGFCYVPYHFVYDVSFPALIQIYDGSEMFQFPIVAIIDKNVPRKALLPENVLSVEKSYDLCEFSTQSIEVNIFDVNLNRIDANLSYECFSQQCRLGESKNGRFVGSAPACVNGYLKVRKEGYEEKKQIFSTNNEDFADVILDREHETKISVNVGGISLVETAIVVFERDDGETKAVTLPGSGNVTLTEGGYEVKVYVYGNSSLTIPATTKTQCVEVPRKGILSLFGGKEEKCFNIEFPETKIEHALVGGGKLKTYFLEGQLEKGGLTINAGRFASPATIEQLTQNFEIFDTKRIGVEFYDR